ncbi:hypothetical protein RIF29_35509 [Crotalaria pallida]|uniref:Uncharacterized protein n=1 Tax=Crotalaria pallida TaxID=3830 RepID=A0AAN9EAG5_CROPI
MVAAPTGVQSPTESGGPSTNEEDPWKEENQHEINDNINANSQKEKEMAENFFGPWMLVKKPLKRKEKIWGNIYEMNGKKISTETNSRKKVATGSKFRYEILESEDDTETEQEIEQNELSNVDEIPMEQMNSPKVGQQGKMKNKASKIEKVRSSLGGKNPQNRSAKPIQNHPISKKILGPAKTFVKGPRPGQEKELVPNVEGKPSRNQHKLVMETDRSTKKQMELDVLRRMNYIQNEKKDEIGVVMTEVVLPNKETLEFVHRRAMAAENQSLVVKPPDPNQHTSMDICSDVKIDSQDGRNGDYSPT